MMTTIKIAQAEGRSFVIGQLVRSRVGDDISGHIIGFARGLDGVLVWAKIRPHGTKTGIVRLVLQDIEPDPFNDDASLEMQRRGFCGKFDAHDMRALNRFRALGMTGEQAGAHRAMELIRQ